jgi:hypothetical protein
MSMEGTSSVAERGSKNACFEVGAIFAGLLLWTVGGQFSTAAQNPAQNAAPSQPALESRPPIINPDAKVLLDKTIQALGGAAFLNFKTMTTKGRAFAISDEQTTGLATFESATEYPDKRRVSYGKNPPVILINNGAQGWEIDRYGMIPQKLSELRAWQLANRYSLENLLRVRIHEPGMLIQKGGVDFVDQLPARILTIVDARQTQLKLYIHESTFLPVRIEYRIPNSRTGDWDEYAVVYGDYREIQNIQTPMQVTSFKNDERVSETFRNSVKYNESYPAGYFEAAR